MTVLVTITVQAGAGAVSVQESAETVQEALDRAVIITRRAHNTPPAPYSGPTLVRDGGGYL